MGIPGVDPGEANDKCISMQTGALIFLTFQLVDILYTLLMDSQHITQFFLDSRLSSHTQFAEFGQNLVFDTFP